MISLVVLPSLVRRATYSRVPGIVSHAGHYDPPQRGVGLAVSTVVEAVADLLAGGGVDRADAVQRGEAGLAAQPVGLSPTVVSRMLATRAATSCLASSRSGAACSTSSSSAASRRAISAVRVWWRLARAAPR